MAFERLQQVWSNDRTLQRAPRHLLVDKPAGVPCRPRGERDPAVLDLPERLRQHGLGEFEPCQELPERASGVTLLAPPDSASQPAALRDPIEWRDYVLGLEDAGLPVEGQLRAATSGGVDLLDYRVSRRHGSRALVAVRARTGPEDVLRAFAAAGHPIVGT